MTNLHPVIVRGIAATNLAGDTRMLLVTLAAAGATEHWIEAWERDLMRTANVGPDTVRSGLRRAQAANLVAFDCPRPGYYRLMLNRDEIAALAASSIATDDTMLAGLELDDELEDVTTRAHRSWAQAALTDQEADHG